MREGDPGHEGDGRVRPGEANAISDIETVCLSSAAREGDVAFSKKATPELAYLKLFFQRMDGKWKAVFFSNNRALSRLEFGHVKVRFRLDRDGKLREAAEVEREGSVSDQAVEACLEGVRRAAPHEPFPANLGDRDQITMTIVFLYR
jgi:outer membrane biosynthesis protein TonB